MYESHTICRSSIEFMRMFKYVRVDKRNPMVERNEWLREIMLQRREIHKLFDLVKCHSWQNIFERSGLKSGKRTEEDADLVTPLHGEQEGYGHQSYDVSEFKNLILRDCYFSFEQL